jgi:hypothetical protein
MSGNSGHCREMVDTVNSCLCRKIVDTVGKVEHVGKNMQFVREMILLLPTCSRSWSLVSRALIFAITNFDITRAASNWRRFCLTAPVSMNLW